MTPEEKLCSRSWRLRNSAGVLWSILSLGFLTGVGFLIRGVKAKNKLWIGLGIGFSVAGIALGAAVNTFETGTKAAPIQSVAGDIWGWAWFLTFGGGVVLTFIYNRAWLRWKAHSSESKWYAQGGPGTTAYQSASVTGFDANAATSALTVDAEPMRGEAPGPQRSGFQRPNSDQPQPLDINAASIHDMTQELGVDQNVAARILAARQASGPFSSFEQMMAKTGVQPHLLIPLRHQLVFGQAAPEQRATPAQGSVSNARRLDL